MGLIEPVEQTNLLADQVIVQSCVVKFESHKAMAFTLLLVLLFFSATLVAHQLVVCGIQCISPDAPVAEFGSLSSVLASLDQVFQFRQFTDCPEVTNLVEVTVSMCIILSLVHQFQLSE